MFESPPPPPKVGLAVRHRLTRLRAAVGAWLGRSVPGGRRGKAGRSDSPRAERREAVAEIGATFARLRALPGEHGKVAVDGLAARKDLSRVADALSRLPASADLELCVLCLDLDDFRAVNERFGRAAGDTALRQVAARLRAAARDGDVVLRLGGDEFVVIAPCATGRGKAVTELIATRLLEQMRRPFTGVGPSSTVLGGCIGTARWRPGRALLLESVAQAEEALLAAKRAGRCELRHYAARGSRPRRKRLETPASGP